MGSKAPQLPPTPPNPGSPDNVTRSANGLPPTRGRVLESQYGTPPQNADKPSPPPPPPPKKK